MCRWVGFRRRICTSSSFGSLEEYLEVFRCGGGGDDDYDEGGGKLRKILESRFIFRFVIMHLDGALEEVFLKYETYFMLSITFIFLTSPWDHIMKKGVNV